MGPPEAGAPGAMKSPCACRWDLVYTGMTVLHESGYRPRPYQHHEACSFQLPRAPLGVCPPAEWSRLIVCYAKWALAAKA